VFSAKWYVRGMRALVLVVPAWLQCDLRATLRAERVTIIALEAFVCFLSFFRGAFSRMTRLASQDEVPDWSEASRSGVARLGRLQS
jgi:hypothetical protein